MSKKSKIKTRKSVIKYKKLIDEQINELEEFCKSNLIPGTPIYNFQQDIIKLCRAYKNGTLVNDLFNSKPSKSD